MACSVFKSKKLKSAMAVHGLMRHNSRSISPPNADSDLEYLNQNSGTDIDGMNKYFELRPENVRKNAVHAIEFMFTAPGWKGDWDSYLSDAKKWADKTLGGKENCIYWAIHRDEKAPHLHAMYMPLVDGKLNAKKLIGGTKNRMRELQDDFWKTVGKQYQLERGEPGNRYNNKTSLKSEFKKAEVLQEKYGQELAKLQAIADVKIPEFKFKVLQKKPLMKYPAGDEYVSYEKYVVFQANEQAKKYASRCAEIASAAQKKAQQFEQLAAQVKPLQQSVMFERDKFAKLENSINTAPPETLRKMADLREKQIQEQTQKNKHEHGRER